MPNCPRPEGAAWRPMGIDLVLGGLISLGLLVYLVYALMRAETL
jgi:K+-transporting ATPase KdpF subunit